MSEPLDQSDPKPASLTARLAAAGEPKAAVPKRVEATAGPDQADDQKVGKGDSSYRRRAMERLRATQLGPSAARTANAARRTWISMLFFPVFGVYVVVSAARDLIERVTRGQAEQDVRRMFRRSKDMPVGDDRSVADISAALEKFPYNPSKLPTQAIFFRDAGPDALGALLSPNPDMAVLPHLYPRGFTHELFHGADDHRIAGMQSFHDHVGPAVIICHGLLMTKNFDSIISLARRAYADWGFHVITLDLRSWGQTSWTTTAPSSGGYDEGRDIVEIARMLKQRDDVTSVGVIGYSLGGSSALNAAREASQTDEQLLDGGIIAISAPSDIHVALEHISTKPAWSDPFFGLWHIFKAAIRASARRRGLGDHVTTWRELTMEISAPYYDVTWEEFCGRASAANFAGEITIPTLEIHAADDFLVPIQHAYWLRDAAGDNENVHVMVRDSGAHCAFRSSDPRWFDSVLRRWCEYWAVEAPSPTPVDEEFLGDIE